MAGPIHITLLRVSLLLCFKQCCDSTCDDCFVTKLEDFDDLLIKDYEIWNRTVTNQGVCFRLCHTDALCASFQHNTNTGTCRAMAVSFTSLFNPETSPETGNRLYITCKASNSYGSACLTSTDCLANNTDCISGTCQCSTGFTFSSKLFICTQAQYVGCYEDRSDRMLPHSKIDSNSMTTEVCVDHCLKEGYVYAGTQYAKQCFCGDNLPAGYDKKSDAECNKACKGDSQQMCGGNWRNSVHLTGL